MELNEKQREIIEKKVPKYKCPLCGGNVLHYTTPVQLLFIPDLETRGDTIELKKTDVVGYLCGQCQNCGYAILRNLEILLKDS